MLVRWRTGHCIRTIVSSAADSSLGLNQALQQIDETGDGLYALVIPWVIGPSPVGVQPSAIAIVRERVAPEDDL